MSSQGEVRLSRMHISTVNIATLILIDSHFLYLLVQRVNSADPATHPYGRGS